MGEEEAADVNWLESVSAIETEKGIVYFCSQESCQSDQNCSSDAERDLGQGDGIVKAKGCGIEDTNVAEAEGTVCVYQETRAPRVIPIADFVSRFEHGTYMYSITAYNPLNKIQNHVLNLYASQLLLDDLQCAFSDQKILNGLTFFPTNPLYFERGYTVVLPLDYPKNHRRIVHDLAVKYRQAAYFKCRISATGESEQAIVHLDAQVNEVEESLIVIERPLFHPAFLHRQNNGVFHTLHHVLDTLSKCDYLSEAMELIKIVQDETGFCKGQISKEEQRHPILAIEGSSVQAGMSEQCSHLSSTLGATYLPSPPTSICHLKKKFDAQNDLVRGAYYAVANYITASMAEEARKQGPVVLDRFWNSTAAIAISSEIGRGVAHLPPRDHYIYEWPGDLLKPDAVVLLGSKKGSQGTQTQLPTRGARRNGRLSQQLMYETLRRMKTSSWIEVDHVKDRCRSKDAVTMVTIDKLGEKKIVSLDVGKHADGICPSSHMGPSNY